MEWRHPSVIAIMGPPYTGKTSIALHFVDHIRCCMFISLEQILDTISDPAYTSSSPPPPEKAKQLISQAFDVICRVVETQLSLGLTVIIDSQLSSRSQLHRLVHVSTSLKAKFVIVDCKIDQEYAWQTRFEKDHEEGATNKLYGHRKWRSCNEALNLNPKGWYKTQTWEDVTKLIHRHNKIRLDEPIQGVSRLLVNVDHYVRERHVVQAVQALIFCQDDRHVDFQKWDADYHVAHDNSRFCKSGHILCVYREEGVDYEANCGVCEKPVLGAAYTCKYCPLALHKSCAEMEVGKISFTPQKFPTFIRYNSSDPPAYSFPENHACLLCREAGQEFSDKCHSCIFETHLKCGLIPTVIKHDGHDHKLYFSAIPIKRTGRYNCLACGMEGLYSAYGCYICGKDFHVECALLPYPVKHRHGGYEHDLKLMFSRDEKLEDYLCDDCGEKMNPEAWYYDCGECSISYHLRCAFKDDALII